MDLEIVGYDGLVGSETTPAGYLSDCEARKRLQGSGFLSPVSRPTLNYMSENGQHMLCFSSPNDLYHNPSGLAYGGGFGRGPFTQSQWVELENQALIFKYINANAHVPSNLLIPILKASSFPPFSVGWGPFHVGFSNGGDPEPGRCRRTDGKKWRCSRDSVPDHKYCERHMNRGRHRSRKPVEGQTGRSLVSSAAKLVQATAAPSDGLSLSQPGGGGSTAGHCSTNGNRVFLNSEEKKKSHSGPEPIELTATTNLRFGLLGVDSLLNNDSSNYNNHIVKNKHNNNYLPFSWCSDVNNTDHNNIMGRTQLSISIPMMSDFIPSTNEDHFPSTEMGLGLGEPLQYQKQSGWVPVHWGSDNSCMGGGPLGEVILNKRNQIECTLDLMSSSNTTCDNSPPQGFGSSPTGVLHRVHFGSVSNSSTGSSPRTESHIY